MTTSAFRVLNKVKKNNHPSGAALVLVLAFLVLITGLVLAFFSSVSTELGSAKSYASGVSTKLLADSAVGTVMAQIRKATGKPGVGWASQPGMIRTYGDVGGTASDKPLAYYKLYSSDNMEVTATQIAGFDPAADVDGRWDMKPAMFADMNSPAQDAEGKLRFPIIDPRVQTAPGTSMVEGFAYTDTVTLASGSKNPVNKTITTGGDSQRLPMPVKWIYQLKDGTFTAPTGVDSGGNVASWTGAPAYKKPGAGNPIVGRIAFWTDDETCKLNINVNSEGIYWDRAWAGGSVPDSPYGEAELRDRMPVKGEYQRYPGHPAMTCLSSVFGFNPAWRVPTGDTLSPADHDSMLAKYYDLVPRVTAGGTKGGTQTSSSSSQVDTDSDRLYASIDELAFAPKLVSGRRETINRPTPGDLSRLKFFLTATGRCAEVTIFNTPRVMLWQLQQEKDPNGGKDGTPERPRNAKDNLLAFCGTVNGYPYYFQRYSIYMRIPVNNRLLHPNIPSQQLPEFGYEPPSSQRPYLDWAISRNQQIYSYLQRLTDRELPGFGGKLAAKYPGTARDQILTEMVDLIRMGTNAYSTDPALPPRYEYAPARQMPDAVSGETQIVPLVPNAGSPGHGTKGFGRFPTITEAALIFFASAESNGKPTKMRAVLAFEPYNATAGSLTWSPLVRYVVKGLDKIVINDRSGLFRDKLVNLVTSRCGYGSGGNHATAHTGTFAAFRYWMGSGQDNTKTIKPSGTKTFDEEKDYPFVSDDIPLNPSSQQEQIRFSGGEITVEIHAGYATATAPETLVQTVRLRFRPGQWPLPRVPSAKDQMDYNNRIGSNKFNLVDAADTVRSVEVDPKGPTRGDLRMVSAMKEVPSNFFDGYAGGADGPGYDSTTATIVHSLRNGDGSTVFGGKFHADLFDGSNSTPASSSGNPIAARGTAGANMTNGFPGDWDNGPNSPNPGPFTIFQDGCYVNKPDDLPSALTFTPNRQINSPVVFGSLPAGSALNPIQPWRTLLFCANPAAGDAHPGFAKPRDHVFLDFFTMPVVEPYAISEPLSSAGKVNLNYQIAPFAYIRRATGLHGVLKSVRLTAIPNSAMATYKGNGMNSVVRKEIDATETLKGFDERFNDPAKGGMFRSSSEICDMQLVPKGAILADVRAGWWKNYALSGDNAREAPYGHIYSRVTTKSNTYTVHYRVQVLKKSRSTDVAAWNENKDTVVSEQRGASVLERYVDASDKTLPDFATDPTKNLDAYYKFRVLSTKRF